MNSLLFFITKQPLDNRVMGVKRFVAAEKANRVVPVGDPNENNCLERWDE